MPFVKAKPEQAAIKMSIYGPQGSGKTVTALLFAEGIASLTGKRIAYIDTERGTDFYAKSVPERKFHPHAFDFDALYTRSIAEMTRDCKSLNPEEHSVIVLDSISHVWDAAMDAYTGRRTKSDGIPMHAWGKIKKPYKSLIQWLVESPFHVFILGRQKNLFETDDFDNMKKVGVSMRAEGETAYEPHICLRMEADTVQTKGMATVSKHFAYVEKDRSGILQGRVLTNPTFDEIRPIMGLLGDTQGRVDNEDERIAQDSELLDKQEKEKFEKSQKEFATLQAELYQVKNNTELAEMKKKLGKRKRYLVSEHVGALADAYRDVAGRF